MLRTLVALAACVCVALVAVFFAGYAPGGSQDKHGDAAVPKKVYEPFGWQQSVDRSAPGRSTVLFSGDGWGLSGPKFHGKIAVVGRDGRYRMQQYRAEVTAGEDVLLSPDGRYLADASYQPGGEHPPARIPGALWITDLTTGKPRQIAVPGATHSRPIAWSSSGTRLVVQVGTPPAEGPWTGGTLVLLNLAGGAEPVTELSGQPTRPGQLAAFSPDGKRLAVQLGNDLVVVNLVTGDRAVLTTLGPSRRLAGSGAWSEDGRSIAIVAMGGCTTRCDASELEDRTWRFDAVDAVTGAVQALGVDAVTGLAVRLIGIRPGGELVIVRYRPDGDLYTDRDGAYAIKNDVVTEVGYRAVSGVEVLGLRSGHRPRTLLAVPPGTRHVDVAADLVRDGKFNGRSPRPLPWPAPPWVSVIAVCLVLAALYLIYRIRR